MDDVLMRHLLRVAKNVVRHNWPYSQQFGFNEHGRPCSIGGFIACDAVFQAAGLGVRLAKIEYNHTEVPIIVFGKGDQELTGGDALCDFFDITWDQMKFIFGTGREIRSVDPDIVLDEVYNNAEHVVRRIERVMAGEFSNPPR